MDVAHVVWAANLGCLDLNPWAVRRSDVDHPDELRVDLDPQPGVEFSTVRRIALEVKWVLEGIGLVGWPKTSGSRGVHVYVRIEPRWDFLEVRRAALALAREVERRLPDLATSKWWKEERGTRVFLDYNQNARDRTIASVYSVRANPEGKVSCPVTWAEMETVEPGDLTIATVPAASRSSGTSARASTTGRSRSSRCWSSRRGTRRRAWETLRGRRTSRSSGGSRSGCSRARRGRSPRSERRAGDAASLRRLLPLSAAFLGAARVVRRASARNSCRGDPPRLPDRL